MVVHNALTFNAEEEWDNEPEAPSPVQPQRSEVIDLEKWDNVQEVPSLVQPQCSEVTDKEDNDDFLQMLNLFADECSMVTGGGSVTRQPEVQSLPPPTASAEFVGSAGHGMASEEFDGDDFCLTFACKDHGILFEDGGIAWKGMVEVRVFERSTGSEPSSPEATGTPTASARTSDEAAATSSAAARTAAEAAEALCADLFDSSPPHSSDVSLLRIMSF